MTDPIDKHKKHKHKKRKHKSKSRQNEVPSLSEMLTFGLIKFPALQTELPSLFNALDANRGVNTDSIVDNELKLYLNTLMSFIPFVQFIREEGWCKMTSDLQSKDYQVKQLIVSTLLKEGSILPQSDLSNAQVQSTRFSSVKFLFLVEKFPGLVDELDAMLTNIIDGSAVNLNDIDNEDLVELLEKFLLSLGLMNRVEDDELSGYSLPSGASKSRDIIEVIQQYQHILQSYAVASVYLTKQVNNLHKQLSLQIVDDHNQDGDDLSSDTRDDEDYDSDSDRDKDIQSREHAEVSIGPAMPTQSQLLFAQKHTQNTMILDDDSQDDNIGPAAPSADIGPQMKPLAEVVLNSSTHSNLPLGYAGLPDSLTNIYGNEDIADVEAALAVVSSHITTREEWMLTPGERDVFSGKFWY